jgi:hypothetical protein
MILHRVPPAMPAGLTDKLMDMSDYRAADRQPRAWAQ